MSKENICEWCGEELSGEPPCKECGHLTGKLPRMDELDWDRINKTFPGSIPLCGYKAEEEG